ncbi:type III secretion system export apparatus subunit SctU [Duganella sp.]|uniref:type III secretion system export apparatus subunit SctU n=1 Tax=Duganella sp. TaxID=1904440 RepID=UPI0031D04262
MSDEKTEEPSAKKMEDAKRDGKSPKSTDITAAAVLLGNAALMIMAGPMLADGLRSLLSSVSDLGAISRPDADLLLYARRIGLQGLLLLAPFLLVSVLAAVIGTLMQTGFNLSMKPVEPKFDAVNPGAGLTRIFSARSMVDLAKMAIKAVLIFAVMWKTLTLLTPMIVGAVYQPALDIVQLAWQVLTRFLLVGAVLFLLIGVPDYAVQRWLFIRDQRMSKDEVKREHKESDGDPHLKGQRKAIAKEIAHGPPPPGREQLRRAQAVIVNPTHYAVALCYDPHGYGLPQVVAKGLDEQALEIRRLAQELAIPVIGNPPLARALYTVPLGGAIPETLFETVAVILKWVRDIGTPEAGALPPSSSHLVDPL